MSTETQTILILAVLIVLVLPALCAGVAVWAMLSTTRIRKEARHAMCACRALRQDCKQFRDDCKQSRDEAQASTLLPFLG